MLRMTKQGFTLIELMVVIVIIGVLASLAIPRFSEASIKAKVAEAPRIIASFESAFLAAVAEGATLENGMTDLIFESPKDVPTQGADPGSKWFIYAGEVGYDDATGFEATYQATTRANIGGGVAGLSLGTEYTLDDDGKGTFEHSGSLFKKYAPNFATNLPSS